jgi:hypothetical protein
LIIAGKNIKKNQMGMQVGMLRERNKSIILCTTELVVEHGRIIS